MSKHDIIKKEFTWFHTTPRARGQKITRNVLILMSLMVFIASCGTIIKTNEEVISIDSHSRGHSVLDQNNKSIGETPFFYQVEKKRNQNFTLLDPDKISTQYQCQFDFSESIIPNIITGVLNVPLGVMSLGVDWYNGNIYKCTRPIFFSNLKSTQSDEKKIKNILIIPPFTRNHLQAKYIEQILLNKKKVALYNFINLDIELSQIGITSFSDNQTSKINFNLLNPLLLKNHITHLMFFKISDEGSKKIAIPYMVDVFSHLESNETFKEISVENAEDTIASKYLDKFHFIPNSFKMTTASFDNNKEAIQTSPHPKAYPKIFSTFTIGNVYSPFRYDPWDYDFYSSTTFALPAWKSTYLDQQYLFQSFTGLINGGIMLKTPVGALSLEVGYGAMYFYEKPSNIKDRLHPNFDVNVSYVFYFTKKLFLNVQYVSFMPVNVGIGGMQVKVPISTIGIGYYFPEGESLFREVF